ncbi:MAG TPA: hypothetical protein VG267_09350 [Terracidiphilus sp.]|jgi:hypothetical protein|nr:hypothetical protein [Terracidiphilus sp.]
MAKKADKSAQYVPIIVHVFRKHWKKGTGEFEFHRDEMVEAARTLRIERPDNLGDVIYSFKFRRNLPNEILQTAPKGKAWILEGAGQSRYRFRLAEVGGTTIEPRPDIAAIKVPDSTPEIIAAYALGDEQALLARVRYNRLIDIFLGLTTYSLQNHLRTQVQGLGQIEIDEIYVGLNKNGAHFIVPVQAKGGSDRLSPVQTRQDIACCKAKFPGLICRPVSAQFMADGVIALFELTVEDGRTLIVEERHYRLVPSNEIDGATKREYAERL